MGSATRWTPDAEPTKKDTGRDAKKEKSLMLSLLRTAEMRLFLLLALVVTALGSILAFLLNGQAAVYVLATSFVLIFLFLLFTKRRYRKIRELSHQIDRIVHGDDSLSIASFKEGELSLLQTEVQKMTVRLREQTDNLVKDKRYLSESIADVAHQIRTPLTSLNLLITLLAKENLAPERRLEGVRELETLLARIDWLVTALLKIAKLDAGTAVFNRSTIELSEFIAATLEPFVIPLDLRNITVNSTVAGTLDCDVSWTAEALGNIVKNCIEHLDDGGTIQISSEQTPIYTQIVIRDNGSGFDTEDLPHIFERFYKGEQASEGNYGIGLALTKMIISEQNGTIKAQPNEPQGACFDIKFYHHSTR
ncbi:MAG: HAMP domain-containing histidine kinase [Coriobacteriales bacterium]|nr:HAMP domain-containing histidine kinase [Coriobacteriales bacterium]